MYQGSQHSVRKLVKPTSFNPGLAYLSIGSLIPEARQQRVVRAHLCVESLGNRATPTATQMCGGSSSLCGHAIHEQHMA